MNKHQITDSDIVDTILGQATSHTEQSVQAARKDADFDATYDEWTRILASAKSEAQRTEAITRRVNANVMESIRRESLLESTSASGQGRLGRGWLLRSNQTRVLMPLAPLLAACLLVAIVAPKLFQDEASIPVTTQITYVDFSVSESTEGGSENVRYNTLEEAIQATPRGGTILVRPTAGGVTISEPIRIAKPLRIQSQNAGDGAD